MSRQPVDTSGVLPVLATVLLLAIAVLIWTMR